MSQVFTGLQLALFGALALLMVSLWRHQRRTKRGQDELLKVWAPRLGSHRWFRVNVSRPAAYARILKLQPFEGKGLLIDEGEQVRVVAVLGNGERLERTLPVAADAIRWVGNASLSSGNLHWLALGHVDDAVMVCADTGMNALLSREATSDILRALLPGQPLATGALQEFALEKNRASLAVAVLFVGVLCLTLGDIAFSEHELLEPRSLYFYTALLGMVGLLAYPALHRSRVPAREAMVLSGLLAVALCGGLTRGALRLDQWLAGGAVATAYKLEGRAHLTPLQPGPPVVTLRQVHEYWDQFDPGTVHQLDIVHGPLGLWQLDRRQLNAVTRDWYQRSEGAASAPAGAASH